MRLRRGGAVEDPGEPGPGDATYGPVSGAQWVRDHTGPLTVVSPGGTTFSFSTMAELQTNINAQAANSVHVATASNYTLSGSFSWTANKHPRIYVPSSLNAIFNGGGGDNFIEKVAGGLEWHGGTFQNVGSVSSADTMSAIRCQGNVVIEDVQFLTCFAGIRYDGATESGQVRLRRLTIQDARFIGVLISGSSTSRVPNPIMEFCHIDNANTGGRAGLAGFNPGGEASGCKNLHVENGIYRFNWIDNSYGFGLWWDSAEAPITAHDNVSENNLRAGIFYEVSDGGSRINNNYLIGNGLGDAAFPASNTNGWQLEVSCSDGTRGVGTGIEVDHNIIDGSVRLLGMVNHSVHPHTCKAVNIHDNEIYARSSSCWVGGYDGQTTRTMQDEPSNDFQNQRYHVISLSDSNWRFPSATSASLQMTYAQWQALGFDTTATRDVI